MSINRVEIVGNLTADPKKSKAGETPVIEFGIAVNEWRKGKDGEGENVAHFFECKTFGKRAVSLSKILHKGMKVAIAGTLLQDRWQNDAGENRSRVVILVDEIEFMTAKQDNEKDEIPW